MTEFYRDEWLTVLEGDNRAVMRELPADSIHCVMTSPPYYGLRDYGIPPVVWAGEMECPSGHDFGDDVIERADTWGTSKRRWQHEQDHGEDINAEREPTVTRGAFCSRCNAWRGQLGLEPTPALYVEHLVETFREVRRVLHPEGLVWLNLGDSYAADRSGTEMPAETMAGGVGGHGDAASKRGRPKREHPEDRLSRHDGLPHRNAKAIGLKHKDLIGIPWMAAFALRSDGWYLRRDVVWSKPNPMPESAEDRPASSHEYVFMLSRSERYFYDRVAVLEPTVSGHSSGNGFARPERISGGLARGREDEWAESSGRNRRSVWTIPTKPYKGAHYAVFPKSLVEVPVKASTSQAGACPECGAQWVRLTTKAAGGKVRERSKAGLGTTESRETRGLEAVGGEFTEDVAVETLGWRPGCGHGWGGDPDDLDIIASPMRSGREPQPQDHLPGSGQRPSGQRGNRTSDIEATTRRGLDRERQLGEGRRLITRFEQRAYARQLKTWDGDRQMEALDDIAMWLGKDDELAAWRATPVAGDHPGGEAWRHYLRDDRRGARAIPPKLFDRWIEAGWLTKVEPPDYSGALAPVPSVVMDIYGGSGTVGLVAQSMGRRAILIDINGEYLIQQMTRNAQIGLGLGV